MIDWNTEKTNHDYEREIKQEKIKEMFQNCFTSLNTFGMENLK
jgi:hypothetical protein